jgi:hypothetical protein
MFVIRVAYPGGYSVWLTRRFPSAAWGLEKDALSFPTEADAARLVAHLRPGYRRACPVGTPAIVPWR